MSRLALLPTWRELATDSIAGKQLDALLESRSGDTPACTSTSIGEWAVARRAGFMRVCLGDGKNGMVRYLRKEVEAYEASRQVVMG